MKLQFLLALIATALITFQLVQHVPIGNHIYSNIKIDLEVVSRQMETYCPSKADFTSTYGTPWMFDRGWTIRGPGDVATKASFNLINGWVEFDVDFSQANPGVNCNLITISPSNISPSGYKGSNWCQYMKQGDDWCPHSDWIESNGNCGAATTLHTTLGKEGQSGFNYLYNGQNKFHMKLYHDQIGNWTVEQNGIIRSNKYNIGQPPTLSDLSLLKRFYEERGAVIMSSQWVGQLPFETECGAKGGINTSQFTVSNLKIYGELKQGPKPRKC